MYITMTAMVCLTVLILALEIRGVRHPGAELFCELRGRKLDSELFQISTQITVYVKINTISGIMNTVMLYLKEK